MKLGEGAFGVVKLVTSLATGLQWACKVINKDKAGSVGSRQVELEMGILKKVYPFLEFVFSRFTSSCSICAY